VTSHRGAWCAAAAVAAVLLALAALATPAGRLTGVIAPAVTAALRRASPAAAAHLDGAVPVQKRRKAKPYTSPSGLFIQERASKGLPGPGQHFSFGALKPWDEILGLLNEEDVGE